MRKIVWKPAEINHYRYCKFLTTNSQNHFSLGKWETLFFQALDIVHKNEEIIFNKTQLTQKISL
jgi:hypothetical protein